MTRKTHEQGIAAAEAFAAETGLPWYELRQAAARHLSREWEEMGITEEGMGTSDVSCHLSYLFNYEPEVIIEDLRPLTLIARAAKGSGKTYEEFKDLARRMFEPA